MLKERERASQWLKEGSEMGANESVRTEEGRRRREGRVRLEGLKGRRGRIERERWNGRMVGVRERWKREGREIV